MRQRIAEEQGRDEVAEDHRCQALEHVAQVLAEDDHLKRRGQTDQRLQACRSSVRC